MKKSAFILPLIPASVIGLSEALLHVTFKGVGDSTENTSEFPPFIRKLEKGDGNLAALLRMLSMFSEVDTGPLPKAIAECKEMQREDMSFVNDKGVTVYGTLYKAEKPTDTCVFFSHGYNMTGLTDGARYICEYHKMGFDVFAPDHQNQGRSSGGWITFGEQESKDCLKWMDVLNEKLGTPKMFIHGISMGCATACLMSDKLPSNVKFIIADCGFTDAISEFNHVITAFHIPKAIASALVNYLSKYYTLRTGYHLENTDAKETLVNSKVPVLFIHGDDDIFVPHTMGIENYEACGSEKDIHIFPNVPHSGSYYYFRDEFMNCVQSFIKKYL